MDTKPKEPQQLYQITIFSAWIMPQVIHNLTLEQAIEKRDEYRNQQYLVEVKEEN